MNYSFVFLGLKINNDKTVGNMSRLIQNIFKNKRWNLISILSIVFISFSTLFLCGLFHSSAGIERTAEYLAYVAEHNTKNNNKEYKYTALMVEPKDGSKQKIADPYNEFVDLYGTFREGPANYIGAANSDKKHNVKIKELKDPTNFSFLNVDRGFGVEELVDEKTGAIKYRQSFYPLDLMFYSNHPVIKDSFSFLYISQRRADDLLNSRGIVSDTHTSDDYKTLLNSLMTVEIDGIEYNFAIDNIYYENNDFTDAVNEVMGEFFLAGARYPETFKRQGIFFLRQYPYQNQYYIQHASTLYSRSEFDFKILERNFIDTFKLDYSKVIFYPSTNLDFFSYLLVVLSCVLLLMSLLFISLGCFTFSVMNMFCVSLAIFSPYFVLWLVQNLSKNLLVISNFSTRIAFWVILIYIGFCLFAFLFKRTKKENLI